MNNYDLDSAFLAAKDNELHDWVLSFLRSSGKNLALADKLEKNGQYRYGPIDYPIQKIVNILGSDASYKYTEDEQTLSKRVSDMVENIKNGWSPPPLLASNLWEDYLELADGGHRYKAFQALGINEYPTIFYFRDQQSLDEFVSAL